MTSIDLLFQLTEPSERVSTDSRAKAMAFLKSLTNKNVLCFLFFLLDVLAPLKRLSLLLQEKNFTHRQASRGTGVLIRNDTKVQI